MESENPGQYWIETYQVALVELDHAKMTGRISDARNAIFARIEKLKNLSGICTEEKQALVDALTGLKSLENEEERSQQADRRRKL